MIAEPKESVSARPLNRIYYYISVGNSRRRDNNSAWIRRAYHIYIYNILTAIDATSVAHIYIIYIYFSRSAAAASDYPL